MVSKNHHYPLEITPRDSVESSVPDLNIGQHRSTSSIENRVFTGELRPWPNFERDVLLSNQRHKWRREILGYKLKVRDPYTYGNCQVGDEHGVQGRFQKFFGDVLNTIFKSQSVDLEFSDSKCIPSNFTGTPDVIIKTAACALKVVGELKVPWILDHRIRAILDNMGELRVKLAQPIRYMQSLGCAYGFLSNYEETIFLRQVVDSNGVWRIEYSPVVLSTDTYAPSTNPPVISVKQCFFHVACEALIHGSVSNTTPRWVVRS